MSDNRCDILTGLCLPIFHFHWKFYNNVYVIYILTKYQTSYVVETTRETYVFAIYLFWLH